MSRPQECEDCMAAVAAFGGNTCVNCRKDAARGFFDGAACEEVREACARHIRALLEEHTEALDALEGLDDACAAVASWSSDCIDFNDPVRERARAVLAKAGRR